MTNPPRWILALAILPALVSASRAQSPPPVFIEPPPWPPAWAVTSAPARFWLEPNIAGGIAPVALAKIDLPDPKWATMPIRVFDDAGTALGSEVLWSPPGEPITLVFDTPSNSRHYWVYVGSNWPALHLADAKAGVWLETREGDGKVINNLPDMLQAWKQSTKVLGRAIVSGVSEGGNRFGPQINLLIHLQAWFDATPQEHLGLATISWGSSFVQVDGKEVVEWPGQHDISQGMAGQHQGAVDLSAGPHLLDYYYSFVRSPGEINPVMCCLAANGGPYQQWTMLQPGSALFRPVMPANVQAYILQANTPGTPASGNTPAFAIQWSNQEQSVIYTDVPDIGLISLQLSVVLPTKGTVNWTFDDGSTATGPIVKHLFLRPGLRTVHVSVQDGGKEIASLVQNIAVHPDWEAPYKEPELHPNNEDDVMGRDPATLSAADLASCTAVFENFKRQDALIKILPAVCAKMKQVTDADLPYVKNAALYLARDDWAHPAEEIQFLRALIDRASSVATATPATTVLVDESRLALARLLLKTSDHADEVRSLIAVINVSSLSKEEPRLLNILQADLALATGDIAGARKLYEALTGEPTGPDARSSIRRTAKISQARAFIDQKDFDAAEDSLKEVAQQAPIEKISPDWAITRLRLYQEENQPVAAYLWAKRLLPVLTESSRSELLFRLTDLAFVQGDKDLAHKTLSELLQKHPYSQEAAQAKEKWPGQG